MNTSHPAHAQMHGSHACCASSATSESSPPTTHAHANGWRGAAAITLHCLTGCAIGELAGLAIGVTLHWPVNATIALAVVLAFLCGFGLTLAPMLRRGLGFADAFRTIWLGEVISITTMEIVMNIVDYHMGGMRGVSLASALYWESFVLAAVAGYLAAWPVNAWMLARNMKRCH